MSSHQTDRHHFERQIVYARPIFILLALLAVLEQPPSRGAHRSASFLIAYLIAALLITQIERLLRKRSWHLPLACDLLALGFFMYTSPSTVPVWFPYMFLCYAAGIRWGLELTLPLAGALSLILVLLTAVKGDIHWMRVVSWLGLTTGTFAGGAGLAFLGDRNRRFATHVPRRTCDHLWRRRGSTALPRHGSRAHFSLALESGRKRAPCSREHAPFSHRRFPPR